MGVGRVYFCNDGLGISGLAVLAQYKVGLRLYIELRIVHAKAKEYFEKLDLLVSETKIADDVTCDLAVKHFFSGAALYANNKICVSWSPAGLAIKMPEIEAETLIDSGEAIPLKYFSKGNTKKDYAVFENPELTPAGAWKNRLLEAIQHVTESSQI